MSDGIDRGVDRTSIVGPEANVAAPVKPALQNLPVKRAAPFEHDTGAWLQLLPRMNQRLPPLLTVLAGVRWVSDTYLTPI